MTAAINLRLALLDLPRAESADTTAGDALVSPLLARQRELSRRLSERLCPVDERIQDWLDGYLADVPTSVSLPGSSLVLDQAGLARGLSLPHDRDDFANSLVSSYRLLNGVLHNPHNDRRTTAGVFHIADGGLPISDDKRIVPKAVFAQLLDLATSPPQEAMLLPFTADLAEPAACFVSLLLRPLVVPAVAGATGEQRMEIRFIAPGSLVSNLDFVEGIFGNGGDPYLPENDAALDPAGWTGHTGCVILAPHLVEVTKKELGLPHWDDATQRQRRDGMCYRDPGERYNDGKAFKACARDERGVIVTVIADNYFGYCKKEVKTQIGYSANLHGSVEEEHSGGAIVFPAYDLGLEFTDDRAGPGYTLADVIARDPERFEPQPQGHALDRKYPGFTLVPAGSTYSLRTMTVSWADDDGGRRSIPLRADRTYFGPDGYRVRASQHEDDRTQWSLVGVDADATSCHKPSTVSGGGKSEISKAISDAFIHGSAYAKDFDADMDLVAEILEGDFSDRYGDAALNAIDHRAVLSSRRSVGSVIKLLTHSADYSAPYNAWLAQVPAHVKELVYVIKRYYRPEWGIDWRSHFNVGVINGRLGNAMRLDGDRIVMRMLRVGFERDGSWRLFGLRPDFSPAVKVQTEDDITASIVAPAAVVDRPDGRSGKIVQNCELLLFQRPDDAIHRGYDKQAEADIASPSTFLSNFQPLTHDDARAMRNDAVAFSLFTAPIQNLIVQAAGNGHGAHVPDYFVSSANPRLVDGKPSKNPRYLQVRPDLANPLATAAGDLALHLHRRAPAARPIPVSVDVVAAGRRNNPPEEGVPALCAFNPLHYLQLPELFMEFISSMTGKSPSTTGAGSEGALTKAPFNAMPTTIDLNSAFLSYVLTGYDGWISSAGYIGPHVRVDHDVSLLVPEVFSRMKPHERDAAHLVAQGYLEKVEDVEFEGRTVLASRLGYRMTARFATTFFGRIFMHPDVVFTREMLRPELQDLSVYAETMDTVVATHERVAKAYFDDGTVELACPPLRALLEVMAYGATSDGLTLSSPEFRDLFTRESVVASDWYAARLDASQDEARAQAGRGVETLTAFIESPGAERVVERLGLRQRLAAAQERVSQAGAPSFREGLVGTIGRQVTFR
ncbi:MAG: hypothetical protein Q4P32_10495 [Micrococcales bacterium]|nr:hypothetical protein [Micrococcales bacterium]